MESYISKSVAWWEESQLRFLVLCSLFLQYLLFFAAPLRKFNVPSWFRFLTWLAYIGGDAIAIYALATLFNRHKQGCAATHFNSSSIEVVWAPILLMHLGGQDGITAYNIEDNELWMRHVLTALSQIAVAMYVFWKSWTWPKEQALWKTSLLAFGPGILKCFEKPWALKNASITSLTTMLGSAENGGEINSLEAYVQAARHLHQNNPPDGDDVDRKPYALFVDIVYSYDDRLTNLGYMLRNKDEAYGLVQSGLSSTFDRLYTKERVFKYKPDYCGPTRLVVNRARIGTLLRYVVAYLSLQAIREFLKGDYHTGYNADDVLVTNILLWGTTALEYLIANVRPFLECFCIAFPQPWPRQVAQYNIIGYIARNRRRRELWTMKPSSSSRTITSLVYDHIDRGWGQYIEGTATYIVFNDSRGQRTLLEREGHPELLVHLLGRPFDETVLLWHLATDFCFYSMEAKDEVEEVSRCSRHISNYLVYLLFVNPEMLMTGTRSTLFKSVYGDLKRMVQQLDAGEDERGITARIVEQLLIPPAPGEGGGGLVSDAFGLAEALTGAGMEAGATWRIIQGVWVEMLCFSASRCRGETCKSFTGFQ
ncbi:unnamed protein product [Alopecurus aequalis]